MDLSRILNINKDIIQVYHNKNINFFDQDLVNIAMKTF